MTMVLEEEEKAVNQALITTMMTIGQIMEKHRRNIEKDAFKLYNDDYVDLDQVVTEGK
jgi:hypothetical protein